MYNYISRSRSLNKKDCACCSVPTYWIRIQPNPVLFAGSKAGHFAPDLDPDTGSGSGYRSTIMAKDQRFCRKKTP